MNAKGTIAEDVRQKMLTDSLGQIECKSDGIHGLWCITGVRCSFCQAQV